MKPPAAQLKEQIAVRVESMDGKAEMLRLVDAIEADHAAELDRREQEYAERFNALMKNKSH